MGGGGGGVGGVVVCIVSACPLTHCESMWFWGRGWVGGGIWRGGSVHGQHVVSPIG